MRKSAVVFFVAITLFTATYSQNLQQTIRGRIIDKDSEIPLIGATVQVANTEPIVATISDPEGYFLLPSVPVGRQTLIFSYIGYEKKVVPEILVGSAKEIVLVVRLKEKVHKIDDVEVVYKQDKNRAVNEMAMVSSRQFTVEETSRYAASIDDPSRMATSFAGVAITGNDIENHIMIRGNSPRGMMWQIEGVPIPNPNHFAQRGTSGGGICIISNNVLDNSDFMTGAWPAEYSNALSGVFDIKLRNGNNRKREYAFQAGLLGVDFAAEGPLSKNYSGSYLINYRYSTLALFNKMGIHLVDDREAIPTFQDLTFKLNLPTKKAGIFTLWGIGGKSHLITESIIAFDTTYSGVEYNYLEFGGVDESMDVGATGISHRLLINNKNVLKTSVLVTGNTSFAENLGRLEPTEPISKFGTTYKEDIDKGQLLIAMDFKRKFNSNYTLISGFKMRKMYYDALVQSYNYDSLDFQTDLDKKGNMAFLEFYTQSSYRFTDNLSLYTGLNYNKLLFNGKQVLEPRLALKWQFSNRQSFTVGYGSHSQMQSLALYLVDTENGGGTKTNSNENLDFNKAQHFAFTYNNAFAENWRLKIDLYYQSLSNIPIPKDTVGNEYAHTYSAINDVDWFYFVPLENKGTGRNYGLELSIEKFFGRGWYALATACLYEAKYTAKDGKERDTRFNGNYIFNALGGKEFNIGQNILGMNLKYNLVGGRRYTPIKGEKVLLDEDGNPVISLLTGEEIIIAPWDWSMTMSGKVKDYSRLDASVFFRLNRQKVTHVFTFDAQNVLNIRNIGNISYYDTRNHEYVYWYQSKIFPIFKYRLEF